MPPGTFPIFRPLLPSSPVLHCGQGHRPLSGPAPRPLPREQTLCSGPRFHHSPGRGLLLRAGLLQGPSWSPRVLCRDTGRDQSLGPRGQGSRGQCCHLLRKSSRLRREGGRRGAGRGVLEAAASFRAGRRRQGRRPGPGSQGRVRSWDPWGCGWGQGRGRVGWGPPSQYTEPELARRGSQGSLRKSTPSIL